MILEELVLHDFGPYRDRQALAFAPPTGKPITLIGALNGSGKTTLLEALQLALYGPLASGGRRGFGYDEYLQKMIHRGKEARDEAAVEVAFTTHVGGAAESFRVHRSWTNTGSRIRERLEVIRNGKTDLELTERWPEQVEALLPRGVAPLFFFDGEQIETYADPDRSQEILATSVNALLGLDLVERLRADLLVVERRHRSAAAPSESHAKISLLEGEVAELTRSSDETLNSFTAARDRVARLERQLGEAEERFRREGGAIFERRHEVEAQRAKLRADLDTVDTRLREAAAGTACLLLVSDLLADTSTTAKAQHEAGQARVIASHVDTRDRAVLKALRKAHLAQQALKVVERILDELKPTSIGVSGSFEPVDLSVVVHLESLTSSVLLAERERLTLELAERAHLRSQLDDVDRRMASIPAPDAIAGVVALRDRVAGELASAKQSLHSQEARLAELQRSHADRQRKLERLVDEEAHRQLGDEDDARLVRHAAKARDTLSRFRIDATRADLARIEGFILEALHRLLRKERLITSLKVDPDTFRLDLRGEGDRPIEVRQLSAGERQLLAISMLWGLARASGRPLPVIIDTPLGRLDGTHRTHLLDRYFPYASHQVVLLSTDDEIDAPALSRIQKFVGRSYELTFDADSASTGIQEGYFS